MNYVILVQRELGTYSCFTIRRTPEYLAQSIVAARAEGYALGVKLVRGAYHPQEVKLHHAAAVTHSPSESSISPDDMPPVWLSKDETDKCYDASARLLVKLVREDVDACARGQAGPAVGALFGTHNWESADLVVDELVRQGLATLVQTSTDDGEEKGKGVVDVGEQTMRRVAIAQLYGSSLCPCVRDTQN